MLAVQGSVLGGWSFHLLADGRLCYVHNLSGCRLERVGGDRLLAPGRHDLGFRYRPGEPATGALLVDGEVVGAGAIERATWSRFSLTGAGLTVGWWAGILPRRPRLPGAVPLHRHLDRV